jgi:ABC-type transporter Mla subunit MlaD
MATVQYKDNANAIHEFQKEAGDGGGSEVRPVHGLPAVLSTAIQDTASRLATIVTSLSTLDGHVDGLEAFLDGVETLLTAVDGHVDGLEALITTLNGYADGLEALLGDVKTKLDLVNANLAPTASAINQIASGTSSAAFASQACVLGFWAKNISTGTQKVYIRNGATAATTTGYELAVGEERFFPGTNMNAYSHVASAASANICWEAV